MRLILVFLAVLHTGCGWQQVKTAASDAVTVICKTTTVEARAKIRDKHQLPTDVCGDTKPEEGM